MLLTAEHSQTPQRKPAFPAPPQEYIHRVGRTARGLNGRGHALLILRPEELGFLRYLKQSKVKAFVRDILSWEETHLDMRIRLPYHLYRCRVGRG